MIPLLGPVDPFPPVESALADPNGLVAAGGDLSVRRLVDAYAHGIFPWYDEGDPVLWWSPDPRTVLPTSGLHVSRSLLRRLRRGGYEATADRAFAAVVDACAAPRRGERGTWLVPAMRRAYLALHREGLAHSVEVWMDGALAGGVYGVALGRMFFGESMFSRRTDGSKLALAHLAVHLDRCGGPLIDCQFATAHLASLGARPMPRGRFVAEVARLAALPPLPWDLAAVEWKGGRSEDR